MSGGGIDPAAVQAIIGGGSPNSGYSLTGKSGLKSASSAGPATMPGSISREPPGATAGSSSGVPDWVMRAYQAATGNDAPGNPGIDEPPPGYGGTATPTGASPTSGAPMSIRPPGPFLGVPFNQYGGGPQASPFANLGDQMLNLRHIMHGGAGRFNANNAARFGFAGGSYWKPDDMGWGPA
jgi:hypothetical protein